MDRKMNTGLGITAIFFWSSTVAFARSLSEQIGPFTTASLIYLTGGIVGSVALLVVPRLRRNLRNLRWRYLLVCGSLFVIYMVALYVGLGTALNRSQAIEVGLLNYLWPMLTLLFSIPILKMRANLYLAPGVVTAMIGIFLVTNQNQAITWESFQRNLSVNWLPYMLGILAAVSWGLYSVLSKKLGEGAGSGAVPFFMLATGLLLGLLRFLFPERSVFTDHTLVELLFMSIFPNVAYILWEMAMRKGNIVMVASFSYFTPFLSTMISVLYLGVPASLELWLGCGLIFSGAVLCNFAIKQPLSGAEIKSLQEA
jgi:drug/metabolite transporter (DMT)-like permease